MSLLHLHLLINHLPVFGSILGFLVLLYGLNTKSSPTRMAAYYVLLISTAGAVVSYLTGEPAEDAVKDVGDISKQMIHLHEDFAAFALIGFIITGIASVFGIVAELRNSASTKIVAFLTIYISFISFSLVAVTAYFGGLIRHTEVNKESFINKEQKAVEKKAFNYKA
jgi:uncharacterized membrane protein